MYDFSISHAIIVESDVAKEVEELKEKDKANQQAIAAAYKKLKEEEGGFLGQLEIAQLMEHWLRVYSLRSTSKN